MIYTLLIITILFFLGLGITYLLIPEDLKKYSFWLIPWFGIVTSIVLLVVLSFLGIPVKISAYLLFSLSLILNIFILLKKRQLIFFGDLKENILIFLLICGSLFFLLHPLIKAHNYPTTISLGNNDIIAYVVGSDYLIDNSIQKAIYDTKVGGANDIILGPFRFGPTILYSFFSYIFGLKPYQITYILQAAFFPLVAPLIYILIKILYKKTYIGLLLSFFITVFNVNLLYMFYHNFFPHTIFRGLAYFLLIFFLLYFYKTDKKEKTFINKFDLIISLGLAAGFFSYHEAMLVFLVAPFGICVIALSLLKRSMVYIGKMIKIIFVTVLIGLPSVIFSFRFLFILFSMSIKNQFIGWQIFRSKIPYANPFEAMGFYSIHHFRPMPNFLAILSSSLVLGTIAFGLLKSKFKVFISILLVFYSIILIRAWIIVPNFFDYGRAISYTLPVFIIAFSIGFAYFFEKFKLLSILPIVVLLSLELFSAKKLDTRFLFERFSVDKGYISLKDIRTKTQLIKKPGLIENQIDTNLPLWNLIWTPYFLNLNTPPITIANYDVNNKIPEDSLVLISKIQRNFRTPKILFNNIIWENQYYKIGNICNVEDCLIKSKLKLNEIIIGKNDYEDSLLVNGWNIGESENRWANEKESTLRLVTKGNSPAKLTVEVLSLNNPQEMTVYLNDQLLGKISVDKEWKIYSLPINYQLSQGVQKIKFVYSHGYRPMDVIPGNVDSRTLYVNFKEIKLE